MADPTAPVLEARGIRMLRLREDVASARFGGRTDLESEVRRRLVERLSEAFPPPAPRGVTTA